MTLLVTVLTLAVDFVKAEEPFAPKVDPPQSLQDRAWWVDMIESWQIPGKSEVEVPAYPGAVIVSFQDTGKMSANGVDYETLPMMVLATADEPGKVLEFYKENMTDWKYKNSFGIADVFWKGTDDFNSMDVRVAATQPNVTIMEAMAAHTDFFPKAKAVITIVYTPGK